MDKCNYEKNNKIQVYFSKKLPKVRNIWIKSSSKKLVCGAREDVFSVNIDVKIDSKPQRDGYHVHLNWIESEDEDE